MQTEAVEKLYKFGQKNIPVTERVFGAGSYIRPNFVQFYECQNILVEGITLINSPAWVLHPVLCSNISFLRVNINSTGPNNDGLDPESCDGVLIQGCQFNSGDDCIAIKSGKDHDGRRLNIPCRNIVIKDCHFADGHGGICIGSEISGGVENVFAENCTMDSPDLDRGIRLKTNSDRGGFIKNIFIRNIHMGVVKGAVVSMNMLYYDDQQKGGYLTKIKNLHFENIVSEKSTRGIKIMGSENLPIDSVFVKNCVFQSTLKEDLLTGVTNFISSK